MNALSRGNRLKRTYDDIIECALRNDLDGVDTALDGDRLLINAQRDTTGITPLIAAAGRGHVKMVSHLLEQQGIDIYISDDFGRDAFVHARPFPEIVATLIEAAHPNLRWREPMLRPT